MPQTAPPKPKPTAKLVAEKQAPNDGLTQRERFEQAARELACDDDPERFKERVRKVAKGAKTETDPSRTSCSED